MVDIFDAHLVPMLTAAPSIRAAVNELRLLSSARFDSQSLLCIVLAGDARLLEKLRREEL